MMRAARFVGVSSDCSQEEGCRTAWKLAAFAARQRENRCIIKGYSDSPALWPISELHFFGRNMDGNVNDKGPAHALGADTQCAFFAQIY